MELKGSKTEANLLEAFAGESMARNKYTYYASAAKKEGFEQIKGVFEETAENEKEHAKMIFKFLGGIGSTADNLKAAAAGENGEWSEMYPRMEKDAIEEGFPAIATFFHEVAQVEAEHEARYKAFLKHVEDGSVFKESNTVTWVCRNCGYVYTGQEAPELCPCCKHPKAYFERKASNY